MKKLYSLLIALLMGFGSCYDDSALQGDIDDLNKRMTALEEIVNQANSNIVALQGLVNALENNVYVTGVTFSAASGSYTITFTQGDPVTISNGRDGAKGDTGAAGTDALQVGVQLYTDGVYYWTLGGEWLLVDGQKLRVSGADGKDGTNGITPRLQINPGTNSWEVSYDNGATWISLDVQATGIDGITPRLRVNDVTNFWEVSYDNGATWTSLDVPATGSGSGSGTPGTPGITPRLRVNDATNFWEVSYDNGTSWEVLGTGIPATGPQGTPGTPGAPGSPGDAIFAANGVDNTHPGYVEFTLGNGTTFRLPRYQELGFTFDQPAKFLLGESKTITYSSTGTLATIKFLDVPDGWSITKGVSNFTVTAPASLESVPYHEITILISDNEQRVIVRSLILELLSPDVTAIQPLQATLDADEGQTIDLSTKIQLTPAHAQFSDVTFTSSDNSVAEVDADGIVTGKSAGVATITVTSKAHAAVSAGITVEVFAVSPGFTISEAGVVTAYSGPGGDIRVPATATAIASKSPGLFESNATITSIDLNNVITLGNNAFKSCATLTRVDAPDLEITGSEGFHGCSNLVTVNSPKLKRIGDHAFQGCTKLETIDVSQVIEFTAQGSYQPGHRVFRLCAALESIDLSSFEGNIPFQAFQGCTRLASVNISKATSVGGTDASTTNRGQVFANCDNLKTLDLQSVTILSWRAINTNIESLNVPNVTILRPQALTFCPDLHYVSLPSLVEIGNNAFNYGSTNTNIVIDLSKATGLTTVGTNIIEDVAGVIIYVATEEIKALFPTYVNATVIVGTPL
ncbi:MAG: leucine-rich repeat protein [Odoribacteraceae bacterium]|nr:leucine-rich repeat protein [Odoribacteraceae bacterium]